MHIHIPAPARLVRLIAWSRSHRRAVLIAGALFFTMVGFALGQGNTPRPGSMSDDTQVEYIQNLTGGVRQLMDRVTILEHACVPDDTGGGVTQCANPTPQDTGVRACMLNDSYIGKTQEDTRHMFVQCLDDYIDSLPAVHTPKRP